MLASKFVKATPSSGKTKVAAASEDDDCHMSFAEFAAIEREIDPDLDDDDLRDRYVFSLGENVDANGDDDDDGDGDEGVDSKDAEAVDEDGQAGDDDDKGEVVDASGRVKYPSKLSETERVNKGLKFIGMMPKGGGVVYQKVSVVPSKAAGSSSNAPPPNKGKTSPKSSPVGKSVVKPSPAVKGKPSPLASAKSSAKSSATVAKPSATVAKPSAGKVDVGKKRSADAMDDVDDDDGATVRAIVKRKLGNMKDEFLHAVIAEQEGDLDMSSAPRRHLLDAVTHYLTRDNV